MSEPEASPAAENARWIDSLGGPPAMRDAATARLHALLLRVARSESARRAAGGVIAGAELDDLAHQAADDATVAVVAKLAQFRGESRFTTWASKFVILEVASKLSRHAWRSAPPSAGETWDRLPDRFGFGPAEATQWSDLFAHLRAAVDEELTDHQRRVFTAIVLREVPLDVLRDELGSTRGAIYKTLFDARRKLRARLAADGYPVSEEVRSR